MSHVTSLLPHPSNTPSWLSIREKPEWPHSLSCPVLEGWGLPPGLTSSETGGFGRTCRGHSKWYPWPCGLKKGDALSKKWRWQPLWCGHCPRQTSWSLHLARVPTLVSKPHLQRVSLKWSSLLPLVSLSPPEGPSSFPNVPFQWKPSIPSIPQTSCYTHCKPLSYMLWGWGIGQGDIILVGKVLRYKEGNFPAYKCCEAVPKGGNWFWGMTVGQRAGWGNKGSLDHRLLYGPSICVATTHLCCCSMKAAIDNMYMNECTLFQ